MFFFVTPDSIESGITKVFKPIRKFSKYFNRNRHNNDPKVFKKYFFQMILKSTFNNPRGSSAKLNQPANAKKSSIKNEV
tara:strand:- start:14 stop:250 length:237 start_codon:yes stop_codon:yes gene_type:complete